MPPYSGILAKPQFKIQLVLLFLKKMSFLFSSVFEVSLFADNRGIFDQTGYEAPLQPVYLRFPIHIVGFKANGNLTHPPPGEQKSSDRRHLANESINTTATNDVKQPSL